MNIIATAPWAYFPSDLSGNKVIFLIGLLGCVFDIGNRDELFELITFFSE